jgi:3-oxoacyl-[acyl-carrier protein] reductase
MEPRALVAMVTGAANGIGRAIALRLRDDGFAVAAADIEAAAVTNAGAGTGTGTGPRFPADGTGAGAGVGTGTGTVTGIRGGTGTGTGPSVPAGTRAEAHAGAGINGTGAGAGAGPVAADATWGGADGGILPYAFDVADIDAHEAVLDRIEAELGELAVLVNVAGIFIPEQIAQLSIAAYRRQHAVMLDGPVWLARSAGLRMAARGYGRIVNVTSVHASNGETASLSYDTAKAGLEAATRTLAIELGPQGVLVNSVAPGFVRTRMSVVDGADELESQWFRQIYLEHGRLPLRRPAEPAEIAATVSHLVSSGNTYLTGQRIVVDGGLLVTF